MATSQHDSSPDAPPDDPQTAEIERLRGELDLVRAELVMVRQENERVVEDHARVARGRRKAQKESSALSKALAEVLFRELRDRAGATGRRRRVLRKGTDDVSAEEWQQVLLLHQSPYFRPAWYLRHHLTVARHGLEPALHFLRYGVLERRDPGPDFDVVDYLEQHPDVRASGENPVLHAVSAQSTGSAPLRRTS